MQKILLFHYYELDDKGGVEILLKSLSESFAQKNIETAIVQLSATAKPEINLKHNISLWTVAAPAFPHLLRPKSIFSFLRAVLQFQSIIRKFKPDIVHVHFPGSQSLAVVGASYLPRTWKLVVTVHGSDIRVSARQDSNVRRWQRYLFRRANLVTAVSAALLDDTVKLYPFIKSKSKVIYNGIANHWTNPVSDSTPTSERYVLFVGRLDKVKCIDVLLRAWHDVSPLFPDFCLKIIGEGAELASLTHLTQQLGIGEKVKFISAIPNDELSQFYANADILVLPSRNEGLGIVLIEAASCGTICIGSRVSGISEVIEDGRTGFLFTQGSSKELGELIISVLNLPDADLEKMKKRARRKVNECFLESTMINNYLDSYRELNC